MARPIKDPSSKSTKEKLLESAFSIIRKKGYTATSIDDLCREAGVSKGTFFHYFKNKEGLAVSAAQHWSLITGQLFASAPYHKLSDPLERVLGYIDFRKEILQGETFEFTCLVGTMVQETYSLNPEIRDACYESIFGHSQTLVSDITEAKNKYAPKDSWDPEGLALHTQAVLQGAFILAKASEQVRLAEESLSHLKNYIELLFSNKNKG